MVRQLASWQFSTTKGLHEQLVRYEEALRAYVSTSGNAFPEELVMATIVNGLKEPLNSQVQLRMGPKTKYSDVREWILQYESFNAPWSSSLTGKGLGLNQPGDEAQAMEVDQIKGKYGNDLWYWKRGRPKASKAGVAKTRASPKMARMGKVASPRIPTSMGKVVETRALAKAGIRGILRPGKEMVERAQKGNEACHLCGQTGHWKRECPKGKGKAINQVEAGDQSSQSTALSLSSTNAPSSATTYRVPNSVNRVEAYSCHTPLRCRETLVFDINEVDSDMENFSLEEPGVLMIKAVSLHVNGSLHAGSIVLVYAMDMSDYDGNWTMAEYEDKVEPNEVLRNVLAIKAQDRRCESAEVVVDSGADVSVAPLRFHRLGSEAERSHLVKQDAQGKRIPEDFDSMLDLCRRVAGT